jgi:hypothetical protein
MSRASFSSGSSPEGRTCRPRLDVLEDRFAPGSLLASSPAALIDVSALLAAAQRQAVDNAADSADIALMAAQANEAAMQTTRPVVDFVTRSIVLGESTLTRTDDGITMHLTASGVPAGVYSGWIPLFHPGGTTPIAAGRVAGHVVGEGGQLTLTAHLQEGEIISGHPVFPSGSLQDARLQDIGMVVRYHGPADPGRIYEQTHTFEPGVATDFLFTIHRAA